MKKRIVSIVLIVAIIFTLGLTCVFAVDNWHPTYLYISDNSYVNGSWYNYSISGTQRVRFSVDGWYNSTKCSSVNDYSYLVVSLIRDGNNFVEGQEWVKTKVGTCPDQAIAYTKAGTYKYKYETFTSSNQFCGFKSDLFYFGIKS